MLAYLDRLSDAAALIGAVNCIVNDDGHLVGENTDGKGFLQSLRGVVDPAGKRIVLLGAAAPPGQSPSNWPWRRGHDRRRQSLGRARAVARRSVERKDIHARVAHQLGRRFSRASRYRRAGQRHVDRAERRIGASTGQFGRCASPSGRGRRHRQPARHAPGAQKPQRGYKTFDGVGMIVNQGAIGFKLWTGVDADVNVMRDAAEEFVES